VGRRLSCALSGKNSMSETEGFFLSYRRGTGESEDDTIRVGDPMPRLASVAHHDGLEVAVSWSSGLRAGKADVVDLVPAIMTYKVYRPLRDDPELFKSVHLTADSTAIAWGTDDGIDMAATTVERLAEETMTSSDFRAWLERHAFTYEVAAAQLGISRRLVGYYAGKRRVPRYIVLACRYLDSHHSTQMPSSTSSADFAALLRNPEALEPTIHWRLIREKSVERSHEVEAWYEERAERHDQMPERRKWLVGPAGAITGRFPGVEWIAPRPQSRTRG
jgi:hypothetical protein